MIDWLNNLSLFWRLVLGLGGTLLFIFSMAITVWSWMDSLTGNNFVEELLNIKKKDGNRTQITRRRNARKIRGKI